MSTSLPADAAGHAVLVDPGRPAGHDRLGEGGDRVGLDGRVVVGAGRRDLEEARSDPVDTLLAGTHELKREVRLGLEPVVVEDLGREPAQHRVEAPRRLEEEAAVGRDRGVVAQDVRERRPIGPGRV